MLLTDTIVRQSNKHMWASFKELVTAETHQNELWAVMRQLQNWLEKHLILFYKGQASFAFKFKVFVCISLSFSFFSYSQFYNFFVMSTILCENIHKP